MLGFRSDTEGERSFAEDERAIEGLPIRLVIALVVGVAALGVMMNVLGTFDFGADQEAGIEFEGDAVVDGGSKPTVKVVDDKTGEPISNATVIVRGDTLNINQTYHDTTNSDGEIKFWVHRNKNEVEPEWRTNQETGKLRFEIVPPGDSSYTDEQQNDKMTVIR